MFIAQASTSQSCATFWICLDWIESQLSFRFRSFFFFKHNKNPNQSYQCLKCDQQAEKSNYWECSANVNTTFSVIFQWHDPLHHKIFVGYHWHLWRDNNAPHGCQVCCCRKFKILFFWNSKLIQFNFTSYLFSHLKMTCRLWMRFSYRIRDVWT